METRVDWTRWAENAGERLCPACEETFKPNHPRRRFCGRKACPGRQRRRVSEQSSQRRRPRQRPRAATVMHALLAEALLAAHNQPPAGTVNELTVACADLVRAVRSHRPAFVERALAVRVLTIAAARAAHHDRPAGDRAP
jgi:hypothetical protein